MAMATEGTEGGAKEYIVHHLQHLQKDFAFNDVVQESIVDFSVFNLDSLVYSILVGVIGLLFMWYGARRATAGVPGRWQAAVEILVEMVGNEAKGVIYREASRKFVAPLALTVFIWIFLMNAMDLIPVDFLPQIWHHAGPALGFADYMRVVPSADLSTTLGLSVGVLFICLVYNVKVKGLAGWAHELIAAPFGDHWALWPINFLMQLIEYIAKTVSHGMRLFGNMFAGELVFMLIALMGGAWAFTATGFGLAIGHLLAGTIWSVFHILVITLQAYIFMMLTLIYVGQAHDSH